MERPHLKADLARLGLAADRLCTALIGWVRASEARGTKQTRQTSGRCYIIAVERCTECIKGYIEL